MSLFRDSRHRSEVERDLRYAQTRALSERLDLVLKAAIAEGKRMSKLGEIADRIKTKKVMHDAKADDWAKRLDALDQREPAAFAAGDEVIGEREADLAEMEATMRTLSNLPLSSGQ